MITIPDKLQVDGIKFVLLEKNGKKPFQQEWQNKTIRFDNPELIKHIKNNGNYGIMGGGSKQLIIIDFDNEKIQEEIIKKLPPTFTVKTGRGLLHKYYFSDGTQSFKIFDEEMNTLADIQGEGKQVVGPGSIHPNGNKYEIIENNEIAFIDYAEIKAIFTPYDKKPKKEKKEFEKKDDKPKIDVQDNFLDEVKSNLGMEDVFSSFGIDINKNPTSCPFHSSKGGKCLGFNRDTAHCFHCIHPEQDIITTNGIKKACEIVIGDITFNAQGFPTKVISTYKHKTSDKYMLSIFVNGCNTPLKITENHGCFYYKNIKLNCGKIRGKSYNLKVPKKFIGKVPAKEMTNQDALFIPSINLNKDIDIILLPQTSISNFGPKRKIIKSLPLTNDVLWMFGIYIAEGNSYRGGIKFSLNMNEEEFADRIISTFTSLNIKASKFYQYTKTGKSLLVHVSKTELAFAFNKLFGKFCYNKKVPEELINLPSNKLQFLFRGIMDGDGSKSHLYIKQTSKELMSNLIVIGRKLDYYCSSSIYKKQNNRKQTYGNYFSKIGFGRQNINGNQLNPIKRIEQEEYNNDVIDITVEGHPSILTPQGIIGNCDNSWNIFSFVKEMKKCDFKEALEYLANLAGLQDKLEISKRKYLDSLKDEKREDDKSVKDVFIMFTSGKDKKWGEASESLVRWIKRNNYIYTTRDDEKTEMWVYRDGIYIPQGKSKVKEDLRELLGSFYSQYIFGLVINKLEPDTFVDIDEFFSQNYIDEIPVKNGILNLRTRELKPFSPEKIFFNKINAEYNSHADCPKIDQFLSEILSKQDDKLVFYEIGGFCMWKEYKFEKAFMFVGDGRNGKDKSLELIKRMLGLESCCSVPLGSLEPDSFCISDFFGKMVNIAGDINNKDLKDTSMFKALTGRSIVSGQRKFLKSITFQNYAKFLFACNDLPMVYDNTKGFWDRWVLLEYPYTFVVKDDLEKAEDKTNLKLRDEDIIEKISTPQEMSGLLNKFLDGLDRLLEHKNFSSTRGSEEIKTLWIRKSNSFMAFCLDNIEDDYEGFISKKDLRKKYVEYCKEHKVGSKSDVVMKITLQEMFGVSDERREIFGETREYVWLGIKWKKKK